MEFPTVTSFRAPPALALASALVLGACSSRPEPAPELRLADFVEQSAQVHVDEAAARQALADRWRGGSQLIADGNRQQRDAADTIKKAEREIKKQQDRLAKAQKSLADANSARTAGAEKLAAGQKMKADAEAQFRAAYPEAPLP